LTYFACVRYLYSLGGELRAGVKFDLERIRTLLAALGNPERSQRFVHVAGTNGKGSTCAMIANALKEAGYRTGLYTSPHLVEPTERIQINGHPISRREFTSAFEAVHRRAEELMECGRLDAHPSFFETITAMAFLVLADSCDITVLEVGLGGRLDATNVVTPDVCVITPIAYDHEAFLGNTIEAIAGEKAGILKPGVPTIVSPQSPAAQYIILERARELGCPLVCAASAPVSQVAMTPERSNFSIDGVPFECGLPGRHQVDNAVTAILACHELRIPIVATQTGVRDVEWPGRLELVSQEPDFLLDGAHNPAGAAALAAYIREFCRNRPVWIVYGAMRDKAVEEVTSQLFPLADCVILSAAQTPRSLRPEAILEISPHPNTTITHSVSAAIDIALKAPDNAVVFFTGSLFLVGEARGLLVGHPHFVK